MRLRFTKVDEFQFLTCVKHEVWGSKSNRFADWQKGDLLAIIVNKQIAGVAEVSGEVYKSEKIVWDNGLFPYRIPLKFKYLFTKEDRPHLLGSIRDALINAWTTRYGWGILNQHLLDDHNAEIIYKEIKSRKNQITTFLKMIDSLIIEASQERNGNNITDKESKRTGRPKKSDTITTLEIKEIVKDVEEVPGRQEESLHSKAQYFLAKIGQITGCRNFIASNDRKRKYNNIELGSLTLPVLPNLGLDEDVVNRISLIDVIWLKQNAAICAFEVETSTSIYSGLLRMSDLLSVIPNLNIKLYIVAQKEREDKVLRELARPTFRKIGLNDYCEFLSIEDLESLLKKIENLTGHIQPTILDTIAIGLEEENE